MADAITDPVTVAVVLAVVVIVIAVAFFEMRFLRKQMKNRRVRAARRDSDLQDEAHNAVVTTKAISATLERQGVRSPEVGAWIREAELAYERRNYRVTMEITSKAKTRLLALKSAQTSKGDLAKLETLSTVGDDVVTTKELLTKEIAPNLLQSKFSIELAETAIGQAQGAGRDVSQATELLEAARGKFGAKDYDTALSVARLSKRAAEGHKVEVPVVAPPAAPKSSAPSTSNCPSCGASIHSDDTFCRKCGTRLGPSACTSCGTSLLSDDAFCRKCGTPVSR